MELVFNSLTNNTNQTALNLFLPSKIRIEHTDELKHGRHLTHCLDTTYSLRIGEHRTPATDMPMTMSS